MRILVAVKQVPDTSAPLKVLPGAREPYAPGVPPILNPYDEFALEAALRMRDSDPAAEVSLVTLSAVPVEETLFHGLAMGADRALLLRLPAKAVPDALATGELLAAAVAGRRFDAVFCGDRAVDDDAAQVGPTLAERLGIPFVRGAEEVWLEGPPRRLLARCRRGDAAAVLRADLPCVVGFVRGPRLPRYASLDGIFGAAGKPIDVNDVPFDDSANRTVRASLAAPFEERAGETVPGTLVDAAVSWLLQRIASRALIG
jgi:electron transfer flavoprotein beta subunit